MLGPYRLADGPMLPLPTSPRRRRLVRGLRWLGLIAAICGALVLAHRPLLAGFAGLFRVDDPAQGDAIVVLLGGLGHRPLLAAQLYRDGLAPLVLFGDSDEDPLLGFSESSLTRDILIRNGVPPTAIHILPPPVTSTRDEALRVLDFAREHPTIRRITVVTSAFHTARARWIFRRVLRDEGIDVHVAAAALPGVDESNWYKKDEGLVLYFSEAIKTLYYRLMY